MLFCQGAAEQLTATLSSISAAAVQAAAETTSEAKSKNEIAIETETKTETQTKTVAKAGSGPEPWLELVLVPWQLSPIGVERMTAALAGDRRLSWLEHAACSPAGALNEAWRRARGTWIWWLEAGDQLQTEAIRDWRSLIQRHPGTLLVAGEGEHLDGTGQTLRRQSAPPARTWVPELALQGLYCPGAIACRRDLLALTGPLPETLSSAHLQGWLMRTLELVGERCVTSSNLWVRTHSCSDWQAPGRCRQQALELSALVAERIGEAPGEFLHGYGLQLQRGDAPIPEGKTLLAELADVIQTARPLLSAETWQRLQLGWGLDAAARPWQVRLETALAAGEIGELWCVALLRNLLHPELGALHLGSPWGPNLRLAERLLGEELWGQYRLLRQDHALLALLNQPVAGLPLVAVLHWLQEPRLQQQFRLGEGTEAYGTWWASHAGQQLGHVSFTATGTIAAEPWAEEPLPPAEQRPFGVNLIGHAFEVFGIGEDVRMAALALESAGVPFCVVNVAANNGAAAAERSLESRTIGPEELGPYRFNLVCLAAPSHGAWIAREGLGQQRGRTTVVAWPWETQTWPEQWECLIPLADAFWPSTTFTAKALEPYSTPSQRPLQVMPMAVHIEHPDHYRDPQRRRQTRLRWRLAPEARLVLFVFDVKSSLARKNPWAAITAFQEAFPLAGPERVHLVIKALRPQTENPEWTRLQQQAASDPRLSVIEADLCRADLLALIGCCDVFLSLHRSEGFGRGIAEAALLGLQVVASDFGGNLDFCQGDGFHLVPCQPWPIPAGAYPHAEGHLWGDPDVSIAAQRLREAAAHGPSTTLGRLPQLSREATGSRYLAALGSFQLRDC